MFFRSRQFYATLLFFKNTQEFKSSGDKTIRLCTLQPLKKGRLTSGVVFKYSSLCKVPVLNMNAIASVTTA